jgi:hypothetical protein
MIIELSLKSSSLWALVWPKNPWFIPNLSVTLNDHNWVSFNETGYHQFIRFPGY